MSHRNGFEEMRHAATQRKNGYKRAEIFAIASVMPFFYFNISDFQMLPQNRRSDVFYSVKLITESRRSSEIRTEDCPM